MTTTTPLSRNRAFRLLWGSQVLSEIGFSASTIAFPLLVLVLTGSPAASGIVLGADSAAQLIVGLPAGALVDRWDRRKVMLACEAVQAVVLTGLVLALWWGRASVGLLVGIAAVIGACRALFEPAEQASLPRVVPAEQLPTAVAMNTARAYVGQLGGTALGGVLFAVRRWLPFAAEAVAHGIGFVALLFLRLPAPPARPAAKVSIRQDVVTGLRWMWGQRLVRVVAACAISINLFFQAFYLVVIALAHERGMPSGEIGVIAAMFGAGGILGALAAPRLNRLVSPYLSIIGVFWVIAVLTPVTIVAGNGYLLGALFAAMAFLTPSANTTITTYQLLLTPDELQGRLSSVMSVVLGVSAVAGPSLGGALMQVLPGDQAVLVCTAGILVLALLATISPTLRRFPEHQPDEANMTPVPTEGSRHDG